MFFQSVCWFTLYYLYNRRAINFHRVNGLTSCFLDDAVFDFVASDSSAWRFTSEAVGKKARRYTFISRGHDVNECIYERAGHYHRIVRENDGEEEEEGRGQLSPSTSSSAIACPTTIITCERATTARLCERVTAGYTRFSLARRWADACVVFVSFVIVFWRWFLQDSGLRFI